MYATSGPKWRDKSGSQGFWRQNESATPLEGPVRAGPQRLTGIQSQPSVSTSIRLKTDTGVSSAQHLLQNQKQVALESDGRTRTRLQRDPRVHASRLPGLVDHAHPQPHRAGRPCAGTVVEVDHDECAVRPTVDSPGGGEEAEHFGVRASALEKLVDRGFRVRHTSPPANRGDLEAVQLPACGVRDDQIRKRLEPDQQRVGPPSRTASRGRSRRLDHFRCTGRGAEGRDGPRSRRPSSGGSRSG